MIILLAVASKQESHIFHDAEVKIEENFVIFIIRWKICICPAILRRVVFNNFTKPLNNMQRYSGVYRLISRFL